jgi:hypothetical protein
VRKALHNDILNISHKVYVEILPHDFLDFMGNGQPSVPSKGWADMSCVISAINFFLRGRARVLIYDLLPWQGLN